METDFQKFLDELRARVSVAEVVGAKVKLVRKGREYMGLCPFHNEKTPSFTVNEAKGFYHCFGCGAHGDIIKFEMEANGLPFMDAVTKLANKAGLRVPQIHKESPEEVQKRSSWYEITELAAAYFEKNLRLTAGREAMAYLARRGFDENIIKKFRLGYAPDNNGLKAWLASKNVSESDMIELGLAVLSEKNGKLYDFFRDRVIIPIMDKRGRVIAFGGRVMGDGQPKYLNSPDTPVFNKRRVLYNLNYARDKAFEKRRIVVCEGYMDVIAQAKYGFDYAVAPLGTALTEEQIAEAWKICPEPTLCFDGDNAGIHAAIRSIDRALPILKAGYSLKYVFLPDGMDPDEFLKAKGADEYEKALENTVPLADLLWRKNVEAVAADTPEQKALFEKTLLEEVVKIADEKVRGYYLQDMKNRIYERFRRPAREERTERNTDYRRSADGSGRKKNDKTAKAVARPQPVRITLDELVGKFIAAAMFCYPCLIGEYEEKAGMFEIKDSGLKLLLEKMAEVYHRDEPADSGALYTALKEEEASGYVDRLWEVKMLRQQNPDLRKLRHDIDNKILEMQLRQLENEIKECLREIETAESFPNETYRRYEMLKKERETLLAEQQADPSL